MDWIAASLLWRSFVKNSTNCCRVLATVLTSSSTCISERRFCSRKKRWKRPAHWARRYSVMSLVVWKPVIGLLAGKAVKFVQKLVYTDIVNEAVLCFLILFIKFVGG